LDHGLPRPANTSSFAHASRYIVAMPLIPGQIRRGKTIRTDLSYARYSQLAWRWWCRQHGIEFVVFDAAPGGVGFSHMPPTFQRWLIPGLLTGQSNNEDTVVAVIDADTMIRWDAPNFLKYAVGFTAVGAGDQDWVRRSMDAFQHLFPGVSLQPQEYFNAGVVVLGVRQCRVLAAFLDHAVSHWTQLEAVMLAGNFGTDQTPLNFMLRHQKEPVHFLPAQFNLLHCFPMEADLWPIECSPSPDEARFARKAFSRPGAFGFIERAYVWHFSNVVRMRSLVMRETWRRVSANYPGAGVLL
jgi:hypothetical protein